MLTIADLDLVRAQLLAGIAYRIHEGAPILLPFADIEPTMQERITFLLGGPDEGAADSGWPRASVRKDQRPKTKKKTDPLRPRSFVLHPVSTIFFSRLFGELLSQPGYGFHGNYDAGEITANLIESVRKFRQVMLPLPPTVQPDPSSPSRSAPLRGL